MSAPTLFDAMRGDVATVVENAGVYVEPIVSSLAAAMVVERHYLHRRPPISFAFGLIHNEALVGVITLGTPPSRELQKSACPDDPSLVVELNRLWVDDERPRGTESWFIAKALRLTPARIVVSYADTSEGHIGYVYRASNWRYAGWTDMDRKTPRYDYIPWAGGHTRESFRTGYSHRVRRKPKAKYWTTTGNRSERRHLAALCGWPALDWHTLRVPGERVAHENEGAA